MAIRFLDFAKKMAMMRIWYLNDITQKEEYIHIYIYIHIYTWNAFIYVTTILL